MRGFGAAALLVCLALASVQLARATDAVTPFATPFSLHGQVDRGEFLYFSVPLPAAYVQVVLLSTSGDADLYTRVGETPTIYNFDMRSKWVTQVDMALVPGSDDPDTLYIGVYGYSSTTYTLLVDTLNATSPLPFDGARLRIFQTFAAWMCAWPADTRFESTEYRAYFMAAELNATNLALMSRPETIEQFGTPFTNWSTSLGTDIDNAHVISAASPLLINVVARNTRGERTAYMARPLAQGAFPDPADWSVTGLFWSVLGALIAILLALVFLTWICVRRRRLALLEHALVTAGSRGCAAGEQVQLAPESSLPPLFISPEVASPARVMYRLAMVQRKPNSQLVRLVAAAPPDGDDDALAVAADSEAADGAVAARASSAEMMQAADSSVEIVHAAARDSLMSSTATSIAMLQIDTHREPD